MDKQKPGDWPPPPVSEVAHAKILMDVTAETRAAVAEFSVGTLVGVHFGYDTMPSPEHPGQQYARQCGYLQPLNDIVWPEAEQLTVGDWLDGIAADNGRLPDFIASMANVYQNAAGRLKEAAQGVQIWVGMGGVLEGYSSVGYYFYCGCTGNTILMQAYTNPRGITTYCCTISNC